MLDHRDLDFIQYSQYYQYYKEVIVVVLKIDLDEPLPQKLQNFVQDTDRVLRNIYPHVVKGRSIPFTVPDNFTDEERHQLKRHYEAAGWNVVIEKRESLFFLLFS
jgi:hypothetical protein